MTRFIFPVLCLAMVLISFACNPDPVNRTIDEETIELDLEDIQDKNPDLKEEELTVLEELATIAKGYEAAMEKYPYLTDQITEADFDSLGKDLFKFFSSKRISYQDLLKQHKEGMEMSEKSEGEYADVNTEIDEVCGPIQQEIDALEARLNGIVEVKLVDITTFEQEGNEDDLVQLHVRVTNKSNKPIQGVQFGLEFRDKFNEYLTYTKMQTSEAVIKSGIAFFTYSRTKDADRFNEFSNKKPNFFNIKPSITKINWGGEIIPAYGDGLYNFHLSAKDQEGFVSGYCPYLSEDHELVMKKNRIETRINEKLEKRYPAYMRVREFWDEVNAY